MTIIKPLFFQFMAVCIFTVIWCSCVGHPPVFVRESVVARGDTDTIQISLVDGKDSGEDKIATDLDSKECS